jgi:ACS family hexuronate transporter-like MFS transporter
MTGSPPRTSHLRWAICFLAFLATLIIYSDRQFLSLLKPTIGEQIHWTDTQFGLVSSCFLGAYAVGLLFFGWYIDRVGVKIGYATSLGLWSLAALSHTLVGSVNGFIDARIFLGLSEGGNFPAAIKAIAQWFPKAERAFATALVNSGANIGAVGGPPFVAWILSFGSWQTTFVFAGVAGLLWLLLWCLFYAPPDRHKLVSTSELALIRRDVASAADLAPKMPWASLLGYSQTWSFVVAKFLTDPVWFFLLIWLPDYFKKTRDLDIKHSWPHLMTVYALVTALSLFGGWITGHLTRRGWSVTRARKTGLFCFALAVLPIFIVGKVDNWTAVVLIGIVGAAHQSWSANLFTTVSDMFPRNAIGSVIGLGSTAGALGSMIFVYFCGHILDYFGANHAQGAYFVLFCYAGFAYLVAFGLQHLLAPKFEPLVLHADTPS